MESKNKILQRLHADSAMTNAISNLGKHYIIYQVSGAHKRNYTNNRITSSCDGITNHSGRNECANAVVGIFFGMVYTEKGIFKTRFIKK